LPALAAALLPGLAVGAFGRGLAGLADVAGVAAASCRRIQAGKAEGAIRRRRADAQITEGRARKAAGVPVRP
jgi:hypothetical protein